MRLSDYALERIKEIEGLRLNTYRCARGKLTIGYGHTRGVRDGQSIDKYTALCYLAEDVAMVEDFLVKEPYAEDVSQGQWDALVSFIFNLGIGNFKSSTLRKKIMRDIDEPTIPDEFRRWVYVTDPVTGEKKKAAGLVTRREWEAQMYAYE